MNLPYAMSSGKPLSGYLKARPAKKGNDGNDPQSLANLLTVTKQQLL